MIALHEQLIQEIYQVPEENLDKVLAMIQLMRLSSTDKLIDDLRACIYAPRTESLGDFKLDLTNYRFERGCKCPLIILSTPIFCCTNTQNKIKKNAVLQLIL